MSDEIVIIIALLISFVSSFTGSCIASEEHLPEKYWWLFLVPCIADVTILIFITMKG